MKFLGRDSESVKRPLVESRGIAVNLRTEAGCCQIAPTRCCRFATTTIPPVSFFPSPQRGARG